MAHTFLPDPDAITLQTIEICQGFITFHVKATAPLAACPECGHCSDRAHSRYVRTIQDLPWQGNPVRFQLTLTKFFCDNQSCDRKIFAQALPEIARRYQRKTSRLETILLQILWKVGASDAFFVAKLLGLVISDDAMLYQFKKAPDPSYSQTSPEEIGIDDFAFLKGQTYGTIIINLQTRTPMDLLPDRERATVEKWLKEHPGAKVVSRDRSTAYAQAISEGAPEAQQVADRFHLLKNLIEAFHAQISKESQAIRQVIAPQVASDADEGPARLTLRQQRKRAQSRQKRFELWQEAHALFAQGYAKKEIARMMNITVNTVRTYLLAQTFPERQRSSPINGPLSPFKDYLLKRWEEGCHNALQLWREVRSQGFGGSTNAVRDFLRPLREPGMTAQAKRAERLIPTMRALCWLLFLPKKATGEQQVLIETLCGALPMLPQCRDLVLSFQDMMRRGASSELDTWLDTAQASGLPAFLTFVRGIRSDYDAVKAAFSLPWSNGPTEGHVNRLKFLKRQGYGRASFDLLRRRVLPLVIPT